MSQRGGVHRLEISHPSCKNKDAARLHPTDQDLSVRTPRAVHPMVRVEN